MSATKTPAADVPAEQADAKPNLRLHKVHIRNLMRLTDVEVTFDEQQHLVIVGGRNAQGKTSFMDGIETLFVKGKPSEMTIHTGAKKADDEVWLCDDDGTPVYIVRKIFKKNETEYTVADAATGEDLPDVRMFLDSLTSKGFGFDPAQFAKQGETAAGRRQQFETLRAIAGIDFTALNEERQRVFNERTSVNKVAERLAAQLGDYPPDPGAPKEPVDVAALEQQHTDAVTQQLRLTNLRADFSRKDAEVKASNEEIMRLKDMLLKEEAKRARLAEELEKIRQDGKTLAAEAVDPAPLREQLQQAGEINRRVEAQARRLEKEIELDAEVRKADALTARLEAIDAEKAATMKAAAMPLPDLALDDDGETVLYQGKPLTVASSAEQLRVSTAVGIAMLRQLKVIIIRDGSFLDRANLRTIAEMAAAAKVQVLVERVGVEGASFVIEDGALADEATIAKLLAEERGPAVTA